MKWKCIEMKHVRMPIDYGASLGCTLGMQNDFCTLHIKIYVLSAQGLLFKISFINI